MDRITYCDVNECTDCPKYGDDCDGDKRLYTHEEAWGMTEQELLSALPSADAVRREVKEDDKLNTCNNNNNNADADYKSHIRLIDNAPSAEAEPTVIRSRTLLPTKDFKEWAKRIREVNPNAVVIPCDAEVVSADSVQGEWIHDGQNFKGGLDWCHCSVCGQKTSTHRVSMYNFCPNCGARMKGGDSE